MEEAIVKSPSEEIQYLSPVMDLATAKARLAEFQKFVKEYLVETSYVQGKEVDGDYGIIPGTKKPTLFKPGSDKLCELYGLSDEYEIVAAQSREDWKAIPPLFDYTIRCILRLKRNGNLVSTGLGSCNSYESRYRWRDASRKCPNCGKEAIIKGKKEYGGGWLCFGKKGGCGEKFADDDPQIVDQPLGRVENDDIASLKNTILKMAKKRCLGSNTPLLVSSSSGISRCRADTLFQMWNKNNREPLMVPIQGGWGKVLGMSREERSQAVRIRLADGSAIFCSGEHVWPTMDGEKLTTDMRSGDVMIRNQPELGGEMTVHESIAWTVGLYLAEGHCDRGHVKFTVAADEIEKFIPSIEKAALIVGGRVSASARKKGNVGDVIVSGPAFAGLMQQFAIGGDCYGKHLSKYAWRQGKDFVRLLLKGYLDGDGYPLAHEGRPQNKWILGFTGENFALADDLRCISAVLGCRHSLGHGVSTCGGKEFPTYEGWISFDEPRYNGKNLEEITDIRVINQKSVLYDIEVEDPHLFMLPNGIVSHNSKIDATLSATRSSGIFTQDMDDLPLGTGQTIDAEVIPEGGQEGTKADHTTKASTEIASLLDEFGKLDPPVTAGMIAIRLRKNPGDATREEVGMLKATLEAIKAGKAQWSQKVNGKPTTKDTGELITGDFLTVFWASVKGAGWTEEQAHKPLMGVFGYRSAKEIPKSKLDEIVWWFQNNRPQSGRE